MKEKRRFIRFEISSKVNYIVQKAQRTEKTGTTKDVCATGLQLLTEQKLETGNKLELKFFIPGALNPVHLNGIVLWSKEIAAGKNSAGIEFGEVEEDNKTTFLKFLCDLMYKKIGKEGTNLKGI